MAKRQSKIDKWELGPRIIQMSLKPMTDAEIARTLKAEGYEISQPTLSRWLKEHRHDATDEVQQILHDHNVKELPKDLEALEEIQRRTRDWANEGPRKIAENITLQDRLLKTLPGWQKKIDLAVDEKARAKLVKAMIKQCLVLIQEYFDFRKTLLVFMKASQGVIETKLRFSGVIEATERGNIYINYNKDDGKGPGHGQDPQGRRIYAVGGNHNAG